MDGFKVLDNFRIMSAIKNQIKDAELGEMCSRISPMEYGYLKHRLGRIYMDVHKICMHYD